MRHYNETCFLTGLPIRKGDRVKALFLAPDGIDKDDPAGRWKPAAMPMSGAYDGMGGISDITPDAGMLGVLRKIQFKFDDRKECAGTLAGTQEIDGGNCGSIIRDMAAGAAGGTLSVLVYKPNARNPSWLPVEIVMAHEWAWARLVSANRHYESDVKGNKALERAMAGTIRSVVRHSCDEPVKNTDMSVRLCVLELASLMAGMGALGMTFRPMSHEDNREDDAGWKTDFYEQVFLHAAMDRYPDAEDRITRLSAQIDWILTDG